MSGKKINFQLIALYASMLQKLRLSVSSWLDSYKASLDRVCSIILELSRSWVAWFMVDLMSSGSLATN